MATDKPKIQGYVKRSLFDQFEAERSSWGLTQSQALEKVFAERYDINQQPGQAIALEERLNAVDKRIAELEHLVEGLKLVVVGEQITSEPPGESLDDTPKQITSEPLLEEDNLLVLCKLYRNNTANPTLWRYWCGKKNGFTYNLSMARFYSSESSVRKQISRINGTDQAPTTREFLRSKRLGEIKRLIAEYKEAKQEEAPVLA